MKRQAGIRRAVIAVVALLLLGISTCRSQPDDALTGQPAALPLDTGTAPATNGGGGKSGGNDGDPYSADWEDPIPGDHPDGDDTIIDTSDDVEADVPPGIAAAASVDPGNRRPGDLVPGEKEEGGANEKAEPGGKGGTVDWEAQEEAAAEEEPENPWAEGGKADSSSAAVAQAQDYQSGDANRFAEGLSGGGGADAEGSPAGNDWPAGEAGEAAKEEVGEEDSPAEGTAGRAEAASVDGGDAGGSDEWSFPAERNAEADQPPQGESWNFAEDQFPEDPFPEDRPAGNQPAEGAEQQEEPDGQGEAQGMGGQGEGERQGEGGGGAETDNNNGDYFFHGHEDPDEEEWQKRKHGWTEANTDNNSNEADDSNDSNDTNEPDDYSEAGQTQGSGSTAGGNAGEGNSAENPPPSQDTAAAKMADSATTQPDYGAGSDQAAGSGSEETAPAAPATGGIGAEAIIGIVLGVVMGAGFCLLIVCVCWIRQQNIIRAKQSEAVAAYADGDYDSEEDEEDEEGIEEADETALMGGIVGTHRALDIEAQTALKSSKR